MKYFVVRFTDLLNQIKENNLDYAKLDFEDRTILSFKDPDKEIFCFIYPLGEEGPAIQIDKFINLGQCNDGAKFSSVGQAVNQAKIFINCTNKNYENNG